MKTPVSQLYEVHTESGAPTLVLIPVSTLSENADQRLGELEKMVRHWSQRQDNDVFYEIAAGAAAAVIFESGLHKQSGFTQETYCKKTFDRDARTIRDWRLTAQLYGEIGGIGAIVQPTAFSQLLTLGKIVRERRREGYETIAKANGDKAPTGAQLETWARENNALIESKKKTELKSLPNPTITERVPIKDHQEAQECLRALVEITTLVPRDDIHDPLVRLMRYLDENVFSASSSKRRTVKSKASKAVQIEMFIDPSESVNSATG